MKLVFKLILLAFLAVSSVFAQNTAATFKNYLHSREYEKAGEIAQQVLNENPKDFDLAISVGDVYYELEKYQLAYSAYTQAKNIKSKDSKVNLKIGRTLVKLGKPAEAITEIKKALDADKKNVDLILELSDAYIASGMLKEAELEITNARSIDSKNANVFLMLGKLYYEQKIWELARSNYEEALTIDPKNVDVRQNLADVYWKLAVAADNGGDKDLLNEYLNRSLQECNVLVQQDEKNANAWRLKAQIHFNADQKLEAAQAYNKFIQLRPTNFKERWRLAELLSKNGVCDSALSHLTAIIETTHEDITDSIKIRAELLLGSCYFENKQYSEAARTFKKLYDGKQLTPDDMQIYALSSLFATDTAAAVDIFMELFKIKPEDNCMFMYRVAIQILKPKKQYDKMIEILNIRLNTAKCSDENDAFCYYSIGTAYFELKDTEKAIVNLKKSLEVNPSFYWSNIYLGDIYYSQKDFAASDDEFTKVIEAAKSDPVKYKNELNAAYQKMCSSRLDTKKYKDLEKYSKDWLTAIPENNEYGHLFLAVAYQGQSNGDQAIKEYREVLKVNKDNKTAKDNLKALGAN